MGLSIKAKRTIKIMIIEIIAEGHGRAEAMPFKGVNMSQIKQLELL